MILSGPDQHAIEQRILHETRWLGVPTQKNPMDAWVYQEIIWETQPDVVVEVGNHAGGSLRYLATVCDAVGYIELVGVDISREHFRREPPLHPRMHLVDKPALEAFDAVSEIVAGRSCLVIEDSAHTFRHTVEVLESYGQLVKPGGYMICEDGVMPEVAAALTAFLAANDGWEVDRAREWPFTWNPGGYLRRVR